MSVFKKLASAFVELPAEGATGDVDIDAILAKARAAEVKAGGDALGTGLDLPIETAEPEPAPAPEPERTPLDWSLSEVYQAGKVQDGRNSANTVLKLLANLAAIPEEQRLTVIRAMDAADDGWDEGTVMADARRRLAVLQHYQGLLTQDEQARVAKADQRFQAVKAANDSEIADLDRQIAQLQAQRELLVQKSAEAKAHAEDEAQAIKTHAEGVRAKVKAEEGHFKALIEFFQPV